MVSAVDRYKFVFRFTCFSGALFIIVSLFWLGAQPVAVGLFPPPLDKIAHFVTFGLVSALLWFSILRERPLTIVMVVATVGALDELHQRFLPGRSASLGDFAADFASAVMIVACLEYIRRHDK